MPDWRSDPDALRPFAGVELIAVDLDGTLVDAEGSVVHQVQKIQLGLRPGRFGRRGVSLTYATGRSLTWVQELERKVDSRIPSGTPLVLYNGSVVVEAVTGRMIARRTISGSAIEAVIGLAVDHHADLFAYSGPLEFSGDQAIETVVAWSPGPARPEHDVNGIPIDWDLSRLAEYEPVAVLISGPAEPSERAALVDRLSRVSDISITAGGSSYIEVRPGGSNKATGLEAATAGLGINSDHVLALGDSDNDVEMLEWAGLAVVVAGSTTAAQEHSDYVTRFGPSQGVIEVLRAIKYARKYF